MRPSAAVMPPVVTLVGAGPGDPDLLTVKAVKALRRATVVLVDDLVDSGVLRYLRPGARVVHVGKRGGRSRAPGLPPATTVPRGEAPGLGRPGAWRSTPQDFIHRLMIAEAWRGECVVRVKGGDPFVFGRGGEEVDALRAAGIGVEVVAGVTAGIAAPAAVGIPVTDRRHAPGVAFVTGHTREGGSTPDWAALARCGLTLVVYMGVAHCAAITAALIDGGLAAHTPAAVIQQGCTARQRSHVTTLGRLTAEVERHGFGAPAILVIGDVVQGAAAVAGPVAEEGRIEPLQAAIAG